VKGRLRQESTHNGAGNARDLINSYYVAALQPLFCPSPLFTFHQNSFVFNFNLTHEVFIHSFLSRNEVPTNARKLNQEFMTTPSQWPLSMVR